jgi:nucleoside-diphosphate-sugar epimerase
VRALITGVAGFIGSTLADRLLADGWDVRGVDGFTPYYDPAQKRSNLDDASTNPRFEAIEADLRTADLDALLDDVDVAFHQAGQPGVRHSWSDGFADYVGHNVLATQRLLEAAKGSRLPRLVYASSSSVYGNADRYPTRETDLPRPHSPYGVTKLAAEHLCQLYAANWGVSTVSLRYFTVYGPRQRPDMAFHRLCEAALHRTPFPMFGDGSHVRDFTYVDDAVRANIAAARADIEPGTVVNVAGGGESRMSEVIELVGELAGRKVLLDRQPEQPGDVARTGGSIEQATKLLDWVPHTTLRDGLAAQIAWHKAR